MKNTAWLHISISNFFMNKAYSTVSSLAPESTIVHKMPIPHAFNAAKNAHTTRNTLCSLFEFGKDIRYVNPVPARGEGCGFYPSLTFFRGISKTVRDSLLKLADFSST